MAISLELKLVIFIDSGKKDILPDVVSLPESMLYQVYCL